jgi:hypothetical protein
VLSGARIAKGEVHMIALFTLAVMECVQNRTNGSALTERSELIKRQQLVKNYIRNVSIM